MKPWRLLFSTQFVLTAFCGWLCLQNQREGWLPPAVQAQTPPDTDGPQSFAIGLQLFQGRQYEDAAVALWRAVLLHGQTPPEKTYDVTKAFQTFMQCYIVQDRMADGLAFVSLESFRRGQTEMGKNYLAQALEVDPNNEAALAVQRDFGSGGVLGPKSGESSTTGTTTASAPERSDPYYGKTPEELYGIASQHFSRKEYEACADVFDIACERSQRLLGPACANAVYCRSMIADWGFNGTQFDADMNEIARLTEKEMLQYKVILPDGQPPGWKRATSVHVRKDDSLSPLVMYTALTQIVFCLLTIVV